MKRQPDTLESIYSEVPKIACAKRCQAHCSLVVPYACVPVEVKALASQPLPAIPAVDLLACTFLSGMGGNCTVYALRPLICRLWGVTQGMQCPHGCLPERLLTNHEARALLRRAAALRA